MPSGRHPAGALPPGDALPQLRARSTMPILIGAGLLSSCLYLSFALATRGNPLALALFPFRKGMIPGFLLHFFLLFALYLAAAWCVFRQGGDRRSPAITLLVFSAAFRAILDRKSVV